MLSSCKVEHCSQERGDESFPPLLPFSSSLRLRPVSFLLKENKVKKVIAEEIAWRNTTQNFKGGIKEQQNRPVRNHIDLRGHCPPVQKSSGHWQERCTKDCERDIPESNLTHLWTEQHLTGMLHVSWGSPFPKNRRKSPFHESLMTNRDTVEKLVNYLHILSKNTFKKTQNQTNKPKSKTPNMGDKPPVLLQSNKSLWWLFLFRRFG